MIEEGEIFGLEKDHDLLLLFDNAGAARFVSLDFLHNATPGTFQATNVKDADTSIRFWSNRSSSKITLSKPNEFVFLAKRSHMCWLVIVGEQIGWIAAKDDINEF